MEYREIRPPTALTDWIHCLWYLRGGGTDAQPVVPDGRAEIVVHIGEPFTQSDWFGAFLRQDEVIVSGQLTRPLRLAPSTEPEVVGIRLTTAGAKTLLRIDMAELTDSVVPLSDVRPGFAAAVRDGVARARGVEARLEAAAVAVGRFAIERPGSLVSAAVAGLEAAPRLIDLATRDGVTPRTLQRRFLDEVGIGPKLLARIVRFRRAYRLLSGAPQVPTAQASVLAGYYDQSHLIRDFKRFTGESPGRFLQQAPALATAFLVGETPDADLGGAPPRGH